MEERKPKRNNEATRERTSKKIEIFLLDLFISNPEYSISNRLKIVTVTVTVTVPVPYSNIQ